MNTCYNPFSLEGKTILITGASSGIGKATAIECSKMGASVIITGRNKTRLEDTFSKLISNNHKAISADLTIDEQLKKLISELPKLDGVVLCAGIGETIPLQFASRKKVEPIFETNFFSQIELLRLLQKKKLLETEGSVVAISSIGGNFAINHGNGPYGASKAALLSWMKFAALEFAPRKIRVNCICPGMVHTPLIDNPGAVSEEDLKKYEQSIPLQRFGEPREIALACVYLLSNASKWVTGTQLVIDGGTVL